MDAPYGFPRAIPEQRIQLPPTWALLLALGFVCGAGLFWVCRSALGTSPHVG